jgi:hypothetical protein
MATHARIFYYARRVGVDIAFDQYTAWAARHPEHAPPQIVPALQSFDDAAAAAAVAVAPAWQMSAPEAELFVDRRRADAAADEDEPRYPLGFADMLRMLQEGTPIPGIRQIPDTIAREPVGFFSFFFSFYL